MVEDIVQFPPELYILTLGDADILRKGHVEVAPAWPMDIIQRSVSGGDAAYDLRRHRKCTGVEETILRSVAECEIRGANHDGAAVVSSAGDVGSVEHGVRYAIGPAAGERHDARSLPTVEKPFYRTYVDKPACLRHIVQV